MIAAWDDRAWNDNALVKRRPRSRSSTCSLDLSLGQFHQSIVMAFRRGLPSSCAAAETGAELGPAASNQILIISISRDGR
jgi:hypothetical protein